MPASILTFPNDGADLATLFTGRYIEIHVFPFSFQEYCQYYDETGDKEKLFEILISGVWFNPIILFRYFVLVIVFI